MINMIFQETYFANYGMNAIESLVCLVFIYFFAKLAYQPLVEKADEIEKRKTTSSLISSIGLAWVISLGIMFIIAYIGWYVVFFQRINNIFVTYALVTTLVLPFYEIMLKGRIGIGWLAGSSAMFAMTLIGHFFAVSSMLAMLTFTVISLIIVVFYVRLLIIHYKRESSQFPPKSKRRFMKRYLSLIIVSWVVVIMFSFTNLNKEYLTGIPIWDLIPKDPNDPYYDDFLLGFQWAFFGLIIYAILTKLILLFLPLNKRPPKEVVNYSILFGALVAFGIWSTQLIVVEFFLSKLFSIILYKQDIRILAIVVAITYVASFLASLKYKFLPRAIEADKRLIQEKMQSMEEGALEIKEDDVVLNVENLMTYFYTEEGVVHAVEGVSFKIHEGEVLGLVGETGCGKSVTALSILQLIPTPGKILSGSVKFEGEDLLKKSKSEILTYRGAKITMIFQDPLNSLNPVFTVGKQISEVYLLHKKKELLVEASNHENKSIYSVAKEWGQELLRDLNIPSPENVIDRYPHELSGGMRQRIQIAMGIAGSPQLLIADEPTTALDVTVQNQILKLMKDLKRKYNTSILFITHDLAIISKMCDRVAVMYTGTIVEKGSTKKIFTNPYHPYTKGLLSAIPIEGEEKDLLIIPGTVPNLIYPPSGCRFHPRCSKRFQPCESEVPISIEVEPNYFVNCHLYDPKFNKTEEVYTS